MPAASRGGLNSFSEDRFMLPRFTLLVILTALGLSARAPAAEPLKNAPTLNDLSLEVHALLLMHKFALAPTQLETLRELAPSTAMPARERKTGRAGIAFRKTLAELREALLRRPPDEDRISDLEEKLAELREGKDVDLDDSYTITAEVRSQAADLLRTLSARQVASYLADLGDTIPDPLDSLLETLDKVNRLTDTEWQELGDQTSTEVGWLLGGLDLTKGRGFADEAEDWLRQVRAARGKDFARQRPELEKSARKLAGQVPPTAVLQHVAERGLAELLSNPRLGAALEARLRK